MMDTTNVLTWLPAGARRFVYTVYGVLSLAATGATTYYGAVPGLAIPGWLTGSLAVLGVLAAPVAVIAATHVQPASPVVNGQPVAPVDPNTGADPSLDWTPGDPSEAGV